MMLALSVAMLGLSVLPTVLATYREKGILRRMRTTPVHPSNLLNAQLLVNIGMAAAAAVLVLGVGAVFFDLGWPENGLAFLLSYVLMTAALLSIGLVIAAVAKTTKFATGAGLLLFFPSMFFAGVWTPGDLMPEWARPVRAVSPMGAGMESIQAAWAGGWPDPLNVLALVVVTVIAGVVAARLFRWE
jgi:ABC-2 type transport system permease protein